MIPPRVRDRVAFYVAKVASFNAAVADCAQMGRTFGSAGRYEWEYRGTHEAACDDALAALAQVEALAATNQVSVDELYAHCGGQPIKTPWSAEALTWCRSTA